MRVTVGGAALATDVRSRAPTRANANNEIFLQFILKILLIFFRPGLRAKSCGSEICPARGFLFLLVVVSVWLTSFWWTFSTHALRCLQINQRIGPGNQNKMSVRYRS